MYLHEYQAKSLLKHADIPVAPYTVVASMDEVVRAVEEWGFHEGVIKVQVHAGGRGKAGGVKFGKNKEEVIRHCKALLGMKIVNEQTGPRGLVAHKLLLTRPVNIKKEFYLAALIDRASGEAMLIASPEGGMEIEAIAAQKPERIFREKIGPQGTLRNFQIRYLLKKMGWKKEGGELLKRFAKLFTELDLTLFEINPLVETVEGHLTVLDAKCIVDDNALFRHPALASFYDPCQETPSEVEARSHDLSFVGLEGDIGCVVNGAGLAMATMDIIHHYGGKPANFLDVGGSASIDKIAAGFKILLQDPSIKAIFVNIFGGIMDCALVAEAIVAADKKAKVKIPLVVRLEGTNVEKGKQILAHSGLSVFHVDTMAEGAQKVVSYGRTSK